MKRVVLLTLSVFIFLSTLFSLSSCHIHSISDEWSANETRHWREATCEHTDVIFFDEAHVDRDGDRICDTCGYQLHVHTFSSDWSYDASSHWHSASCAHTTQKSDEAAHIDENEDGVCDECGYNGMHTHTYSAEWSNDSDYHWHEASCEHNDRYIDRTAHVDTDENGECDTCAYDGMHKHTYSDEWTSDESRHWHEATCEHTEKRGGEAVHEDIDEDGYCDECGYESTHFHTYADDWTFDGEKHWHAASCTHTGEKSCEDSHIDADADGVCDVCPYDGMHVHTYSNQWSTDVSYHWHAANCGHSNLKDSFGNHTDGDGDFACDTCSYVMHTHSFETDWTSDSVGHWHKATCTHTGETTAYAKHTDSNSNGRCDTCNYNIQADIDAGLIIKSEATFANRWNQAESVMGTTATNALKELYDFYGTDWFDWLISLYDSETGCFYYSNSARDYEGFLVDSESTNQTLDMLFHSGAFDALGKDWSKTIPADMRVKCLAYIQSLQDESDGYFYHPQWGKNIGSSRRGRDLDQCLTTIRRMGGTPLYPSPLERNSTSATSAVISAFMETDAHKSTVVAVADARFESEAGMREYLDGIVAANTDSKGYFDSYTFGHILSSESSQIIAAGLGEFVCDYIDANLQNPETGLFEEMDPDDPKAGYQAASGVIKVSAFYNKVRPMKYGEKMIDTIIDVILSDVKTTQITYVFNPIGALSSAISSASQSSSYDVAALRQRIYGMLPEIVDKTIEKLTPYKHSDGSFSYLENGRSLTLSQGVVTSLGYDEGDVNGLACAMHYILGSLFSCLGIERVPMLNYNDYITFREGILEATPIDKSPVPYDPIDFESYENEDMPNKVSGPSQSSLTTGERFEIIEMTQLDGTVGSVLAMDSIRDKNNWFCVDAKSAYTTLACFSLSFDLYVDSAANAWTHQIFLQTSNGNKAYMLEIVSDGSKVYLRDGCSDAYTDAKYTTDLGIEENLDTWMNIKLEYYVIKDSLTGKTTAKIKVYKNGTCVTISDNYFVDKSSGFYTGTADRPNAKTFIDQVYVLAMRSPASSVRFDNIHCVPSDTKTFTDTGVDPYAGGIFGTGAVRNNTLTFEDGDTYSNVVRSTGFGTLEAVAKNGDTDNTALKLVSTAGTQRTMEVTLENTLPTTSCFIFEADVKLDSATTDYTHQIVFKNGNTGVFMLSLGLSGNTVKVKTDLSTGSSSTTDLYVNAVAGEWFTLKIEYYPVDSKTAYIKAYKNGVYTGTSTQYYNKGSASVVSTVTSMKLMTRVNPSSTLYLDDIRFTFEPSKSYN